jgi:hypothetical protein
MAQTKAGLNGKAPLMAQMKACLILMAPAEAASGIRFYPAPTPAEAAPDIRYYPALAPRRAVAAPHLQTSFWHCNMLLRYCDIVMTFYPRIFECFPELCHLCKNHVQFRRIQAILMSRPAILMSQHLLIMANFN